MAESKPGDIFQPGDLLNNTYRIESILGRGGTSEVYRARNDISGRLTAIKVLKQEFSGDEAFLTLMRREEEIRELRHDAIVRYSENHRTPTGLVYLVMDYVDGPALDTKMKQGGMSAPDLIAVCRRVCEGLRLAHGRRIIHRDLSPDNIILRGGVPAEAVIIDFGIAKDANPGAQTIVGNEFAGKYAYAAPEQLSGQTDARSDLYSLGALLLATFRGKRPEPGANPMEVVQKKQQPLDTAGVPEPLKSLIDRLSHPDPAQRFQSAEEVLRAIDAAAEGDNDRTVVVPRAAAASQATAVPPPPRPASPPPSAPPPAAAKAPRSRAGLWVVLVLVLLGAGLGGGWVSGAFDRFLGPSLPVAEPYLLTIEKPEGGSVTARGNAPSEDTARALTEAVTALGGTADLTLAVGAIGESWGADVLAVLAQVQGLEAWKIDLSGDAAQITGTTTDAARHEAVMAALGTALPGTLKGKAEITLKPVFLTAEAVQAVLDAQADCGALTLDQPTALGFGKTDEIRVSGQLSGPGRQVALFDALNAIAEGRKVVLEAELLNPALCAVEGALPQAHSAGMRFVFGYGDRPDENPSGRYFYGENPVIDLVLPAEVTDGYISVANIDVAGVVNQLLPTMARSVHDVATLRAGATGEVRVRISYPLAENAADRIAFNVAPPAGKSKLVVIYSDQPIFEATPPTEVSAPQYADILKAAAASGKLVARGIDSRILTTVEN